MAIRAKLIRPAEDLFDVMLPVFAMSKLLGLAPFQFHRKTRSLSPHFGVFTIIRFVLVVGTMCYICFVVDELKFTMNIGGMALRYELYLSTCLSAVVMILAITNQKLAIETVEEMLEIDEEFKLMGCTATYKNAQYFAYGQFVYMMSEFMLKVILQPFANSLAYLTIYSIFNLVDFINTTMLFQFVNILLLMRQRFIWVNREVKNLANLSKNKNTQRKRKNEEKHGKHRVIQVISQQSEDDYRFVSTVIEFGRMHNRLCIVCKMTNRLFGIQLLVTVTIRFIMIATQLINTYKVIQDPTLASSVTHSIIGIYLLLNCAKLFMIASVSDNTAAKGRDTGIYLHSLWDISEDENTKVQFFSLQILQQNLHFSACGFFKIDYTLIYNIVGAVTTYFIILVQFDLAKMESVTCKIAISNDTAIQV